MEAIGLPVVLCLALYVVNFDIAAANISASAVQADFRVPLPMLVWFVDAYVLALACSVLPSGLICDRLGARRSLLIGIGSFAAASLLCGMARSSAWLIAARFLQGFASGLTIPAAFATAACAYPDRGVRTRMVGSMAVAAGVGVASSPPIAGLLVAGSGWRMIFLVNIPLMLFAVLVLLGTRVSCTGTRTDTIPVRSIGLLSVSLAGAAFFLIEWPKMLAGDWSLVLVGAFTAAATVLFVRDERRAPVRLIPASVYSNRRVGLLCGIGALSQGAAFAIMFLIGLQQARWEGVAPERVGFVFAWLTGPVLLASTGLAFVMDRLSTRSVAVAGLIVYGLGLLILAFSTTALTLAFPVLGVGMAMLTPPISVGILRLVDTPLAGTATGLLNAARQIGALVGIAASGGAIVIAVRHQVGSALSLEVLLRASAGDLASLPHDYAERARVGLSHAIRGVCVALAVMMIAGAVVAARLLDPRDVRHG